MSTKIQKRMSSVAKTAFYIIIALDIITCFVLYPSYIGMAIAAPIGILIAIIFSSSIKIAEQWEKSADRNINYEIY